VILSDFSAITITAITGAAFREKTKMDESLIRHIIMNKFREINVKLSGEFGDHVILCDHRSWRKDYFKFYKANRGKSREESAVDWDMIFRIMDEMRDVFAEHFPFYVIKKEGCEADDLIAAFAKYIPEPVCIVSKDGDFNQLHSDRVHQWEFSKKRFIKDPDPAMNRMLKIIRGDKGDGIPNILSDDDTFVTKGKRQTVLTEKRVLELLDHAKDEFVRAPTEVKRNYDRNKTLIDLTVPVQIAVDAIDIYKEQKETKEFTKKGVMDYLVKNKMIILMSKLNDFFPRKGETTDFNTKCERSIKNQIKPQDTAFGSLEDFL